MACVSVSEYNGICESLSQAVTKLICKEVALGLNV